MALIDQARLSGSYDGGNVDATGRVTRSLTSYVKILDCAPTTGLEGG